MKSRNAITKATGPVVHCWVAVASGAAWLVGSCSLLSLGHCKSTVVLVTDLGKGHSANTGKQVSANEYHFPISRKLEKAKLIHPKSGAIYAHLKPPLAILSHQGVAGATRTIKFTIHKHRFPRGRDCDALPVPRVFGQHLL